MRAVRLALGPKGARRHGRNAAPCRRRLRKRPTLLVPMAPPTLTCERGVDGVCGWSVDCRLNGEGGAVAKVVPVAGGAGGEGGTGGAGAGGEGGAGGEAGAGGKVVKRAPCTDRDGDGVRMPMTIVQGSQSDQRRRWRWCRRRYDLEKTAMRTMMASRTAKTTALHREQQPEDEDEDGVGDRCDNSDRQPGSGG